MKGKKKYSLIHRLIAKGMLHANSGEGGGGGGGGDDDDPAKKAEKLAADLAAAQASVAALTKKNQEIIDANKKATERLQAWDGLDPESIRGMLKQFENDEELKLISEGKHAEVIAKRTEKVEAKYKSEVDRLTTESATAKTELEKAKNTIRDLMIDSRVVSVFLAEQGRETAVPDVIARAKTVFSVEEGEVVARDKDGKLITGADGAMTIKEWVAKLKSDAEHLFPPSQGAGAGGNKGTNVTGIDAKIKAAAASGNNAEYRRLKKLKEEQMKKAE